VNSLSHFDPGEENFVVKGSKFKFKDGPNKKYLQVFTQSLKVVEGLTLTMVTVRDMTAFISLEKEKTISSTKTVLGSPRIQEPPQWDCPFH